MHREKEKKKERALVLVLDVYIILNYNYMNILNVEPSSCFPRLSNVLVLFLLLRLTFSKRQISISHSALFSLSLSSSLDTRDCPSERRSWRKDLHPQTLQEMVRPRRFGRRRPNFRSRSHPIFLTKFDSVGKKGSHRVLECGRTQEWIPNFKRIHRRHGRRVAETKPA